MECQAATCIGGERVNIVRLIERGTPIGMDAESRSGDGANCGLSDRSSSVKKQVLPGDIDCLINVDVATDG